MEIVSMVQHIIEHALMITFFVFIMMVVVEYINILTRGKWRVHFCKGRGFYQYFWSALLGVLPGCLGSFAVVSLYSHRLVSLGAVLTVMIATSGDEAFVMFALIREKTLLVMGALFVIGLGSGILLDLVYRSGAIIDRENCLGMILHEGEQSTALVPDKGLLHNLRYLSLPRGILTVTTALFLYFLIIGDIGPDEWTWDRWMFVISSVIGLFIFITVSEHFLEEHLWDHIVREHLLSIFLWTLGALLLIHFITDTISFEQWVKDNLDLTLFTAVTVGIIPESGPHIIFVVLFSKGIIPFSVLLANSIVQDGHGLLPLLAFSIRDFIKIKAVSVVIALFAGGLLLLAGF